MNICMLRFPLICGDSMKLAKMQLFHTFKSICILLLMFVAVFEVKGQNETRASSFSSSNSSSISSNSISISSNSTSISSNSTSISSNNSSSSNSSDSFDAEAFLERFGYLDLPSKVGIHSEGSITQAVREFQQFVGLPVTGSLDQGTIRKMRSPRCGFPDVIRPSERPKTSRHKRGANEFLPFYNLPGQRWNSTKLTYKMENYAGYASSLKESEQDTAFTNAFKVWSEVTPLRFQKKDTGSVDIRIKFATGYHGDNSPFDGRGETVAHAVRPGGMNQGEIHFDDDEEWTLGDNTWGISLEHVAAHEIGHSLGLVHSWDPTALMAPGGDHKWPGNPLNQNDISRIQALYGEPTTTRLSTPTPRPTNRPSPTHRPRPTSRPRPTRRPRPTYRPRPTSRPTENHCDLTFDAIEKVHDGSVYAFQDGYVYKMGHDGVQDRRRIEQVYRGAPRSPDAVAYDRLSGKLYMFTGRFFWRFTGYRRDRGYPRALPPAFHFSRAAMSLGEGLVALFQSGYRVVFWSELTARYSHGFPTSSRESWERIPPSVDAIFTHSDGYHYVFKGQRYWRYQWHGRLSSGFPRDIGRDWLRCRSSTPRHRPNRGSDDTDFEDLLRLLAQML